MEEEMEQLNERFDKLEEMLERQKEMIIQVTEIALATKQKLESDIKLIKEYIPKIVRRVNDNDTDLTDLKFR